MLRVGINGFGTIGKRVADAVRAQPDMTVAGVAKRTPNYEAEVARDRGYALFAAADDTPFTAAGLDVAGHVRQLVAASDVIVDATPAGVGAQNRPLYEKFDTPAIYQGGEDAGVAPASFNARANYGEAAGADAVRVVSCNTTGLSRVLAPLDETVGIEKARATLVRRGGDPSQTGRGPINDTLPDPVSIPSHHAPDVQTVFPDLSIDTMGMKVPATLMHTHALNVTLSGTPTTAEVRDLLADEDRLPRTARHRRRGQTQGVHPRRRPTTGRRVGELYLGRIDQRRTAGRRPQRLLSLPGDPPGGRRGPRERRRHPSDHRRGRPGRERSPNQRGAWHRPRSRRS